jgi:hypothetical protein
MSIRHLGVLAATLAALALIPAWARGEAGAIADAAKTPQAVAAEEGAPASASEESSTARFQATYVWQRKPAFSAAYSGTNSLSPEEEKRSYTLSATAFLGTRTWQGGELYVNPEMVMSQSLSNLTGMGGLSNGENQKGGGPTPIFYLARLFLRHTWGFGGDKDRVESAPNQLAGELDKQRLVLTAGKLAVIDIFDNNGCSHDPRTQFLNWALMTYGAFDFAADQRGYSVGAALEYYRDNWVFRAGRFEQPIESNGLPLDSRIMAHHGDQVEIEHDHRLAGQPGKVRLLAFRNKARMGGFQDALDYWNAHGRVGVPDVGNMRKDQAKIGFGMNIEQNVTRDIGLFARASRNDGGTETYAFAEIERSMSAGAVAKGEFWGRSNDTIGLAYVQNGLSSAHRDYLANGGLSFFIGDGRINYRPETILEGFYSMEFAKNMSLSFDYQHIDNPAYNADRGPVRIVGARLHLEY